jgi:hypothetical protein
MRILRLLPLFVLFSMPLFAQTGPQRDAQRDPQAVAIVEAAITALGGATEIDQAETWSFHGILQGPIAAGTESETITRQTTPAEGTKLRRVTPSLFLPALVGAVLLQEFQDEGYGMRYGGTSTLGSETVTSITFSMSDTSEIAQVWLFNNKNLPVRVLFRMPGSIGLTSSFSGAVDLSDYRPVLHGLYPFRIVTSLENKPPEIITLESVSPDASAR